ncbi:hypothetical protein JOC54_004438 [Alkalihalobacillus xiaoxiensis]|uniref:Rubrerythrin n=1 Tax=Shouchella xiaoxiensis TaxID=766895 RepID=A0ABS2T028_9BACI|nr:ferritin-like domain-containing protein [Shouchella xiaoxiensis]MBM7841138.1 hypothetical protein [Shouchella xiaoxiensis]
MLFKKRTAPTFSQQSPDASQQQRPQLNHPQSHSPIQTGGKEQQPRQSQSLTTEQLAELQQFMQFSFQSVTDYQFLLEKMPNEHLASIIRNMIEDEKKHYQTMLYYYKSHTGKEPTIVEAQLNRNDYIPALKKAFEQEQIGAGLLEEAARYTPSPRLRDIYTSLARDQQRYATWILSYLTIYADQTSAQKS